MFWLEQLVEGMHKVPIGFFEGWDMFWRKPYAVADSGSRSELDMKKTSKGKDRNENPLTEKSYITGEGRAFPATGRRDNFGYRTPFLSFVPLSHLYFFF